MNLAIVSYEWDSYSMEIEGETERGITITVPGIDRSNKSESFRQLALEAVHQIADQIAVETEGA